MSDIDVATPPEGPFDATSPPQDPKTDFRTGAIVGLFVLAIFYTLHVARSLIFPIVLAVLLDLVLSPVIRALKRIHIPAPLGAGLVLLAFFALVSTVAFQVAEPAKEWISKAPEAKEQLEKKLGPLRRQAAEVTQAVEDVGNVTGTAEPKEMQEVKLQSPGLGRQLVGGTTGFLATITVVLFLTYFLLAAGDLFLEKWIKVLPHLRDKKRAVSIARKTEVQVSVYLFTIAMINTGVGIVTAIAMYFVGMPNPILWGVVAALLNFIPYAGSTATGLILIVVALFSFEDPLRALIAPGVFLVINVIEGNLVTPAVLGRRLSLNSPVVFVSVIFWWYVWGVPGAILAVPMVATAKIFCDHTEGLAPVGEFLGR